MQVTSSPTKDFASFCPLQALQSEVDQGFYALQALLLQITSLQLRPPELLQTLQLAASQDRAAAQNTSHARTLPSNAPHVSQVPTTPSPARAAPAAAQPSAIRSSDDRSHAATAIEASAAGGQHKPPTQDSQMPRITLPPLSERMAMLKAQDSIRVPVNLSNQTPAGASAHALPFAGDNFIDAAQAAKQVSHQLSERRPQQYGAARQSMHQLNLSSNMPPVFLDQQAAEPLQAPHSRHQPPPDQSHTVEDQMPEEKIPEKHPASPAWLADSIQSLQQKFKVSRAEIGTQVEPAMLGKQIAFALLDSYEHTTAAGLTFLLQPGLHAGRCCKLTNDHDKPQCCLIELMYPTASIAHDLGQDGCALQSSFCSPGSVLSTHLFACTGSQTLLALSTSQTCASRGASRSTGCTL